MYKNLISVGVVSVYLRSQTQMGFCVAGARDDGAELEHFLATTDRCFGT